MRRGLCYDERGRLIMSVAEKCFALGEHVFPGSEDGEGHCWDLLNRILDGYVPADWPAKMIEKYGAPTPIAVG